MKIWFDTEFMEDGRTIELLSLGAVREDGACFYAEAQEADYMKANEWVAKNVLPKMVGGTSLQPRRWIADSFRSFCGEKPELWAYYADYDWVVLCQLYGRMVDLPKGWPMYCRDVKQLCDSLGNPRLPENVGEHHALADAKWTKQAWEFLQSLPPEGAVASDAARWRFGCSIGFPEYCSHWATRGDGWYHQRLDPEEAFSSATEAMDAAIRSLDPKSNV